MILTYVFVFRYYNNNHHNSFYLICLSRKVIRKSSILRIIIINRISLGSILIFMITLHSFNFSKEHRIFLVFIWCSCL